MVNRGTRKVNNVSTLCLKLFQGQSVVRQNVIRFEGEEVDRADS